MSERRIMAQPWIIMESAPTNGYRIKTQQIPGDITPKKRQSYGFQDKTE